MKHAFLENNLLFNSAMHSSLGASIAYSHSEKGVGKPHEFTSSQNAVCSNMFFPLVGRLCSRGFYLRFDWANEILAACFTLRGHGGDIDFLWFKRNSRAPSARNRAPWVRKWRKLPIRENLVISTPTARPPARETVRPHHRATNVHSYFGSTGILMLHTYCTSMLWSIDSGQNRISADQSHLTVSRAQVSTHRGRVSFWSYPLTSY